MATPLKRGKIMLKLIEGTDKYYISDEGYVLSNKKKLKPRPTRFGYLRVHIKINGEYKDKYIHRLVAEYYIPNPNNYPEVNHLDGDKSNNNVNNLEWCSKKMNMEHASKNNLLAKTRSPKGTNKKKIKTLTKSKKPRRTIIKYDWNGNYLEEELTNDRGKSTYIFRLSVENKFFYRDKETLIKKYGFVHQKIDVDRIKPFLNNQKRVFIGAKENGEQIICYELKELPCTKTAFYFVFNHDIPDEWGYIWSMQIRHYRLPKR